jgi:hypothetical protein
VSLAVFSAVVAVQDAKDAEDLLPDPVPSAEDPSTASREISRPEGEPGGVVLDGLPPGLSLGSEALRDDGDLLPTEGETGGDGESERLRNERRESSCRRRNRRYCKLKVTDVILGSWRVGNG